MTRSAPERGAARRLLPFGALLAAGAAATAAVPRYRELLGFSLALRSPAKSLALNAVALPETLSLWFRPWALTIEHPPVVVTPARAVAGAALLAGLVAAGLLLRRRFPAASLAILWPLVALIPTHSVVAKLDPVTEKPLYLAWLGPILFVGALAARARGLPRPAAHRWAAVAGVVLAVAAFTLCAKRVKVWQDPVRLWREAAERAPASARAWNNLGMALFSAGELGAARSAFERALAIDPRHAEAFDNLMTVRLLQETGGGTRPEVPR
jgi:tetratricopeptide (TPR) repeat protein